MTEYQQASQLYGACLTGTQSPTLSECWQRILPIIDLQNSDLGRPIHWPQETTASAGGH